jgi:hypothetical protein
MSLQGYLRLCHLMPYCRSERLSRMQWAKLKSLLCPQNYRKTSNLVECIISLLCFHTLPANILMNSGLRRNTTLSFDPHHTLLNKFKPRARISNIARTKSAKLTALFQISLEHKWLAALYLNLTPHTLHRNCLRVAHVRNYTSVQRL